MAVFIAILMWTCLVVNERTGLGGDALGLITRFVIHTNSYIVRTTAIYPPTLLSSNLVSQPFKYSQDW